MLIVTPPSNATTIGRPGSGTRGRETTLLNCISLIATGWPTSESGAMTLSLMYGVWIVGRAPPLGVPTPRCRQNTTCVASAGFETVEPSAEPVRTKRRPELIGANALVSNDARLSAV